MDFELPILITIHDVNSNLISKEFIIKDEIRDIKDIFILANNYVIDDNLISFILQSHRYYHKEKLFNCFVVKKNIGIKDDDLSVIDCFKIKLNEMVQYDVKKILNEYKDISIIYFFVTFEQDITIDKTVVAAKFSVNNGFEKEIIKINNALLKLSEEIKYDWQKIIFDSELVHIEKSNFSLNVKCYFLEMLKKNISYIINYNDMQQYLLSFGIKTINILSEIDNKPFKFILYTPEDILDYKKIPLFMILSSNVSSAYINDYSKMYPNGFLIVECSTRGKHFGNYIGESSVLEVLKFIKKYFKIDERRIYLFGYSSSGTIAISLIEKYPHIFSAALTVSCLCNVNLLNNTKYNAILNICGEFDENLDINYYDKNNVFKNFIHSKNILIPNFNDYTATIFLRNKQLIDNIIFFENCSNKLEYNCNSLLFNGNDFIKIEKKFNNKQNAYFQYSYDGQKYTIFTSNVELISINNVNFVFSAAETHDFFTGLSNNQYLLRINNKINSIKLSKKLLLLYKLELLNIFNGGLRIVYNENVSINNIIKYSIPNGLVYQSTINVNYPVTIFNECIFTNLESFNYLFINCDINNYVNIYENSCQFIRIYKNGFEYNGKRYNGNYSIIQILPNYLSDENFCAFINYNDEKYHLQNLFLRKIILPSDHSINESVYRNCSIVYFEKKYYIVEHYGEDLKELELRGR